MYLSSRSATADFTLKQEVLPVHVLMFVVFSLFCTVTLTCYIFCTIYFYANFSLPIELTSYFLCTELKIIIGKIEDANNKFQSEVFFCGFDLPLH